MKRLLIGLALAAALAAGPVCAAPLYALFVGIDTYSYQKPRPGAELEGLSGSGADVARMKQVLTSRYGLEPGNIIELHDRQADRLGIAAALNRQIEAAARTPGSTVLFYYSGHGGQVASRRQVSGKSSTIIPYDGRSPGVTNDILDLELKSIIDQATAWGVNLVTIFDSCNSGTATRGLRQMHLRGIGTVAPEPSGAPPLPMPKRPAGAPAAVEPGARVHLAAAHDDEAAGESNYGKGQWRGDFTEALAAVLLDTPGATYEEVAQRVRAKLAAQGLSQHPQAEGALLTRFLGSDRDDLRLYTATAAGDGFAVLGGRLAGVTEGSTYDAFESPTAAREGRPLGRGRIVQADDMAATLALDAPAASRPARVYLREVTHAYGPRRLAVSVPEAAGLKAALGALPFVDLDAAQPQFAVQKTADGLRLVDATGMPVTGFKADAAALIEDLRAIAKYAALLALAETGGGPDVTLQVSRSCTPGAACPALPRQDGDLILQDGEAFKAVIANRDAETPYFVYVYDLANDYVVDVLYAAASPDEATPPEQLAPLGLFAIDLRAHFVAPPPKLTPEERALFAQNERDHVLLIASEAEIPAATLTQKGVTRTMGGSPLQQLIAQASSGQRGAVTGRPGRWSAKVVSVRVCPPEPSAAEACPRP